MSATLVTRPGALRHVNISGLAVIAAATALWQLVATVGPGADLQSLPSPAEVSVGLDELTRERVLLPAVGHTMVVTLAASAIGILVGGLFGVLLGLVPTFRLFAGSSFDVLRTIPMVVLMPVALMLWGAAARTEIIVAAVATTWPMLVNTSGGIVSVHPRLAEVGRVFQFSRVKTVLRLVLPAAGSQVLVGARLAVVTALIATIVAEMLLSPFGLGWVLVSEQNAIRYPRMWAVVVVCGVLGYLLNVLLVTTMNRLDGSRKG